MTTSDGWSPALLYGVAVIVRIVIVAVVALFLVLWVRAVVDAWRRRDLSTSAKAAWTIFMLILPFIGLLVYTMLRPSDTQIAQRAPR